MSDQEYATENWLVLSYELPLPYATYHGILCCYSQMQLRRGEKIIDRLDAIEDTKGNNGDRGMCVHRKIIVLLLLPILNACAPC